MEVTTVHYRGAHAAAAAKSGFSRYSGLSARISGRGRCEAEAGSEPDGCGGAAAVTLRERSRHVTGRTNRRPPRFGFTRRQAAFLDAVLHHSGVCLPRQYAAFAGIAYGHKINRFFERLVSRGFASVCPCLHNRALVYHVQHRPLYGCHRPTSEPAPSAGSGSLRHASADAP